jgi:predicted SAM-dependent methyltransferase
MLRLNLGSGQRPFAKPWVNVDAQQRWQPDLVADCSALPYADGSCDMIVLHHVLEHFGCGEALALQREAFRLLAPGGSLLVFVPDMRALAQNWLLGKLDDETYMINIYGAFMGDEHDRHRFGFTAATLEKELGKHGWSEIKRFDLREVPGADIARDWWVLAMEAVK